MQRIIGKGSEDKERKVFLFTSVAEASWKMQRRARARTAFMVMVVWCWWCECCWISTSPAASPRALIAGEHLEHQHLLGLVSSLCSYRRRTLLTQLAADKRVLWQLYKLKALESSSSRSQILKSR